MDRRKTVTPESIAAQACAESHGDRGPIFSASPYDCALRAARIALEASLAAAPVVEQQPVTVNQLDGGRPLPWDRDTLGRFVREQWVRWAETQPSPKPSWLVPYEELSEPDKEADRQIGEAVARWTLIGDAARACLYTAPPAPEPVAVKVKPLEWRKYGNQHLTGWQGQGALGYLAYVVNPGPEGEEGWFLGDGRFDNDDEAKSAAQNDYERRILSAIEPAPVDLREENERLREAVRRLTTTYANMQDGDGEPCPDVAFGLAVLTGGGNG